ncbi:MAG: phage exclusion protein Lit family protein [Candidatus Binatia bacterium]
MNEEILTQAVRDLCAEAAPERRGELEALWAKYAPQIAHKNDKEGFEIGGGGWGLIPFTPRTMGQVWILGFAAWKALEAYCPHVLLCREIVASKIADAPDQAEADRVFEDALAKAEELRRIDSIEAFTWPSHIPEPVATPPKAMTDRAAIDLIKVAAAYVFLHELCHVMFSIDGDGPQDSHAEEIACDRFARDFLIKRIPDYSAASGDPREGVLNKRLMGLALGGFIVLHVTGAVPALILPSPCGCGSLCRKTPAQRN